MVAPTYRTGTSFQISQTGENPFDTIGAVSSDHIVVVVNGKFHVYDKLGSNITSVSLAAFFSQNESSDIVYDPRVVYDAVNQRFFAVCADGREADAPVSNLLINVSKTADPSDASDGWHKLKQDASIGGTYFLDFPMIGFNADVVSCAGKLFEVGGSGQQYSAYVIPKSDLLLASPTLDNITVVNSIDAGTQFAHPTVDLDNGSLPHTLWRWDNGAGLDRLDVTAGYSVDLVDTVAYTGASGADGAQPESTDDLDHSANDRISTNPVRVGGYIYIVIPTLNALGDRLVLFKIDYATNAITAQVTLASAGLDLIYPSISVSSTGEVVVGCTSTGAGDGDYASAMVFIGTDDGGSFTFTDGVIVQPGQRVYDRDVGGRNRWGDYSAVVVDPDDPQRFWSFQTYAWDNGINDWGRKIEVTEIIHSPSGFHDLFGLTIGWHSSDVGFIPYPRPLLESMTGGLAI